MVSLASDLPLKKWKKWIWLRAKTTDENIRNFFTKTRYSKWPKTRGLAIEKQGEKKAKNQNKTS